MRASFAEFARPHSAFRPMGVCGNSHRRIAMLSAINPSDSIVPPFPRFQCNSLCPFGSTKIDRPFLLLPGTPCSMQHREYRRRYQHWSRCGRCSNNLRLLSKWFHQFHSESHYPQYLLWILAQVMRRNIYSTPVVLNDEQGSYILMENIQNSIKIK